MPSEKFSFKMALKIMASLFQVPLEIFSRKLSTILKELLSADLEALKSL